MCVADDFSLASLHRDRIKYVGIKKSKGTMFKSSDHDSQRRLTFITGVTIRVNSRERAIDRMVVFKYYSTLHTAILHVHKSRTELPT